MVIFGAAGTLLLLLVRARTRREAINLLQGPGSGPGPIERAVAIVFRFIGWILVGAIAAAWLQWSAVATSWLAS